MPSLHDQSPKSRMVRARDLLKAKRYDEARVILKGIDHPKAREWLDKLDNISPPKPKKQSAKNLLLKILLGFVILISLCTCITFFIGLITYTNLPRLTPNPTSLTGLSPTITRPPVPTTTDVSIRRCSGQQFLNCYQDLLMTVIEQNGGTVTGLGNERYPDGRLDSWVDVELSRTNDYATARNIMEIGLRTYASSMPLESAGSFFITVNWTHGGRQCFDNAGMGYQTMQRINWENVSQQGIFNAINRNIYGDGDGPYSQIGIAPDPSAFPECNR